MPRIQPIDAAVSTGTVADQLAATRKMLGSTPNMFTTAEVDFPLVSLEQAA